MKGFDFKPEVVQSLVNFDLNKSIGQMTTVEYLDLLEAVLKTNNLKKEAFILRQALGKGREQ